MTLQDVTILLMFVATAALMGGLVRWMMQRGRLAVHPGFIDTVPALAAGVVPPADAVTARAPLTVATYETPEAAHVARLLLEQHQIPAFVADQNIVGAEWWYSVAVHGVKLEVPASAASAATAILNRHAPEPVAPSDYPLDPVTPACPSCGSHETYHVKSFRRWIIGSLLLLNFPIPLPGSHRECDRCGHRWKPHG